MCLTCGAAKQAECKSENIKVFSKQAAALTPVERRLINESPVVLIHCTHLIEKQSQVSCWFDQWELRPQLVIN